MHLPLFRERNELESEMRRDMDITVTTPKLPLLFKTRLQEKAHTDWKITCQPPINSSDVGIEKIGSNGTPECHK